MNNMSYCRFENTARDMHDCIENMPNDPSELSSDEERKAYKRFIQYCKEVASDYE